MWVWEDKLKMQFPILSASQGLNGLLVAKWTETIHSVWRLSNLTHLTYTGARRTYSSREVVKREMLQIVIDFLPQKNGR